MTSSNTSHTANVAPLSAVAVRAAHSTLKAEAGQQRVLRMRQLTHYVNRCRASLYADIQAGIFPKPDVDLGPNAKGWFVETVISWLESRRIVH